MRSPGLALYLAFAARAEWLARTVLVRRLRRGKEDGPRIRERLGHPGLPRPAGGVIWFHAASVGEALSVLELLRRLRALRPDLTPLVTTGTVTSAALLAERLPAGALHQYAPLDVLPALGRFLGHWRPGLSVRVESELWPATLWATASAGVPIILLNARISERSFRGWRRAPLMARSLLRRVAAVWAQEAESAARFRRLGARQVEVTGTLKEGAAPLPHDDAERQRLQALIAGRPLWLAASTHPGEEGIVTAAHRRIRRSHPGALLVLVPRHPERGAEIAAALEAGGWAVARRAEGAVPGQTTDIYLADTLGEMGLWYRLASVAFVGGSLVPVGGHNPFEPAALGSAIIHGPHVANFADGYRRLHAAGAAVEVAHAEALAGAVTGTLVPSRAAQMATAAWEAFSAGSGVTERVLGMLEPHLPPRA